MSQTEIKKFMKEKRLVIGANKTLDKLRKAGIEKVFVSANCPGRTSSDLEKYAAMSGAKLERLKLNSADLGTLCKKQFSIAVLGVLKGK